MLSAMLRPPVIRPVTPWLFTLLILVSCLSGLISVRPAWSAEIEQRLALSFEANEHLLNGSAELRIPPHQSLRIDCGPLQLTGAGLEVTGKGLALLRPDPENRLHIPASVHEQRLRYSWQLSTPARGKNDNLIDPTGITLAGFWHPLADRDLSTVLEVSLPDRFRLISTAEAVTSVSVSDQRQVRCTYLRPMRFLHLAAGPYTVRSRQAGGVTLSTWLFDEDASMAQAYLARMAELIDSFEQRLGPFPYPRFALVENRLPTGYALPGMTLIGQSIIRLPFVRERSLGHEILHAWFGGSIRVSESGGNWSEGLTTFLADQFFAEEAGGGTAFRKAQLVRYQAHVRQEQAPALADFRGSADHGQQDQTMRAVGYEKGAFFFHMLRRRVGGEAFERGLRDFIRDRQGRLAGWEDLEAAFSRHTAGDLSRFFRQWLQGRDIPELTVEGVRIDQELGQALLRFDLVQKSREPYELQVPVRITTFGSEHRRTVPVGAAVTPVTLTLDSLPTSLVVDEDYDICRWLGNRERPPTWSRFLGAEERSVLIPAGTDEGVYQPLVEQLRGMGCTILTREEASNSRLARGSWVLLGDSPQRRSLFAQPAPLLKGLRLEARPSPLAPDQVMILIDSSTGTETRAAAFKLPHYGPYSRLLFQRGSNVEKTVAASDGGIILPLMEKPSGVPARTIQPFERIIDLLAGQQVVYIGETHSQYGDHLLQLQIIEALQAKGRPLQIGLEMFPRSSQKALDAYVRGQGNELDFIRNSGYFEVWGYDYRLYRDIFRYARARSIPLIALNIDKNITSRVFRDGSTDNLTPDQQAVIPKERDLDLPGYQERLRAAFSRHAAPHGMGDSGFIQAQALWDEAMAEAIIKAHSSHPDRLLVVLAGNGHVTRDSGIPPRVTRRLPQLRQQVVTSLDPDSPQGAAADYLMFNPAVELVPAGKLGVAFRKEKGEGGEAGVLVESISPHSHAGKAGLKTGDRLLAIDGQPVADISDVRFGLLDKRAGAFVTLLVARKNEERSIQVELSSENIGLIGGAPPSSANKH